MSFIITALAAAYALLVIIRKIKNIKRGKFCSCGCGECTKKCSRKNAE